MPTSTVTDGGTRSAVTEAQRRVPFLASFTEQPAETKPSTETGGYFLHRIYGSRYLLSDAGKTSGVKGEECL